MAPTDDEYRDTRAKESSGRSANGGVIPAAGSSNDEDSTKPCITSNPNANRFARTMGLGTAELGFSHSSGPRSGPLDTGRESSQLACGYGHGGHDIGEQGTAGNLEEEQTSPKRSSSKLALYFCVGFCTATLIAVGLAVGCGVSDSCLASSHDSSGNITRSSSDGGDYQSTIENGTASSTAPSRIVGGTLVDNVELYPFFGGWWWGCGVTLIAPDIALTAAHCEDPQLREPISFGALATLTPHAEHLIKPVDYVKHPDYNPGDGEFYDFMLLKLETPLRNTTTIRLNTDPNLPVAGQELKVIGYGWIEEYLMGSSTLQQTTVKYIEDCKAPSYVYSYYDYIHPGRNEEHLCAGWPEGGRDACYGDSGGPLFLELAEPDAFVQFGVVSWGDGCGRPNAPGVYARVSTAVDWIHTTACQMSDFADDIDFCNPAQPPTPQSAAPEAQALPFSVGAGIPNGNDQIRDEQTDRPTDSATDLDYVVASASPSLAPTAPPSLPLTAGQGTSQPVSSTITILIPGTAPTPSP